MTLNSCHETRELTSIHGQGTINVKSVLFSEDIVSDIMQWMTSLVVEFK